MRIAVIRFPGSNCDQDTRYAFERHLDAQVEMPWHQEHELTPVDAVLLPGGFSYGDYLRSGAMAAHSPVMAAVRRFAAAGGPVLGICNGFQVLTEAGLLPGQLARNEGLHFLCRDAFVRVETTSTPWTHGLGAGERLRLPIAHNDGRYFAPPAVLEELERGGRVVFRYLGRDDGEMGPGNPNGSLNDIAGISNRAGNVVGMMPHPERACEPLLGGGDGLRVLAAVRSWLAAAGRPPAGSR